MSKMFVSLGFWMTIVLFVVLGYAFGSDCPGFLGCEDRHAFSLSPLQDENRTLESDSWVSEEFPRTRCPTSPTLRSYDPEFEQMTNLQQGGPSYAPGFTINITRQPAQLAVCPGAIEIPRH
jgi:hypothetical protein